MKLSNDIIYKLDAAQRRYRLSAFVHAVIKKYGEDEVGYQAALLTYYSFLSLFPLLLVVTTLADILARHHGHLQHTIITSTTNYFPVLGSQLSDHVNTLHKNGFALVLGLLLTLYGTRGVAAAFRRGVRHIWGIQEKPENFAQAALRNIKLIVVGGLGFLVASVSASLATGAGRGLPFRLLSVAVNLFILFWLFKYLLNAALPQHVPGRKTRSGAAVAAVGLVLLQAIGGYLLSKQLKHLDALYSTFAISLGLLFWIYLQAQLLYYAVEVASVRAKRAWPRSLSGHNLTEADQRALASHADSSTR